MKQKTSFQGMPRFGTLVEGARNSVTVMEFVVTLPPLDRGLELKLSRSKDMGTELVCWCVDRPPNPSVYKLG